MENLGIDDKVRFLGNRSDVNELYQAMDVFVMPSFFEGIPVVGVEAQFADLPCVFSDKVPEEVKFSSKTNFISLNSSVVDWVTSIKEKMQMDRFMSNFDLCNNDYNIKSAHSILEEIYLKLC